MWWFYRVHSYIIPSGPSYLHVMYAHANTVQRHLSSLSCCTRTELLFSHDYDYLGSVLIDFHCRNCYCWPQSFGLSSSAQICYLEPHSAVTFNSQPPGQLNHNDWQSAGRYEIINTPAKRGNWLGVEYWRISRTVCCLQFTKCHHKSSSPASVSHAHTHTHTHRCWWKIWCAPLLRFLAGSRPITDAGDLHEYPQIL